MGPAPTVGQRRLQVLEQVCTSDIPTKHHRKHSLARDLSNTSNTSNTQKHNSLANPALLNLCADVYDLGCADSEIYETKTVGLVIMDALASPMSPLEDTAKELATRSSN